MDPKTANARYHDAAAATYDRRWAIAFDGPAVRHVRDRAGRMLGRRRYGRVLEVGAGTGYLLLNLWRAGYVEEAHATDISEGMLAVLRKNAERVGCRVQTRPGDAERLPYGPEEFDLVAGHAVLHHLPDPVAALADWHRVLRPGGAVLLLGEPTRWGHRLAGVSKVSARTVWRAAARFPGLGGIRRLPAEPVTDDDRLLRDLEVDVDLHTFDPDEVAGWARAAGFTAVRVETEELLASLVGWAVRTIEAEARPGLLGPRWARAATGAWQWLSAADRLLSRALPGRIFYNLAVSAQKPAGSGNIRSPSGV